MNTPDYFRTINADAAPDAQPGFIANGVDFHTVTCSLLARSRLLSLPGQNTDALDKQINEQLNTVLSIWWLPKSTFPEMATKTEFSKNHLFEGVYYGKPYLSYPQWGNARINLSGMLFS
ncbi:hypothetical protein [Pseudocitrobacter faecalis]|uniref:hypothetical protein n=1 Tax=Pseudocitrobacter faecalis TaxID=1398493 RepID=UPI003314C725